MNWLDTKTGIYKTHRHTAGRPATPREALLCPDGADIEIGIKIKKLDPKQPDYDVLKRGLKESLRCWTTAGHVASREKGKVIVVSRTGLLQLDFDEGSISEYDIAEAKQAVFSLPFIAFCGLSVSGRGFYALAAISEPERLEEYAEHCFAVFQAYGLQPDTSKGRRVTDLRYMSYDPDMLIRDNPEPLKVKHFKTRKPKQTHYNLPSIKQRNISDRRDGRVVAGLKRIREAQKGQRWATVQNVAYTLGGLNNPSILQDIISEINSNPAFCREEAKYHKCAIDCFKDGAMKPIII